STPPSISSALKLFLQWGQTTSNDSGSAMDTRYRCGGQPPTATDSIRTSASGRSCMSVSTWEIVSTTSMPDVTCPKTVCSPSSQGQASAVTMKNCEPFVFGPALAIASAPRTTGCELISSSKV